MPLFYGYCYYFLKSILHIQVVLQFPNVFTLFVLLNPLGTPVKEAEIGLMIIYFQEEEIES